MPWKEGMTEAEYNADMKALRISTSEKAEAKAKAAVEAKEKEIAELTTKLETEANSKKELETKLKESEEVIKEVETLKTELAPYKQKEAIATRLNTFKGIIKSENTEDAFALMTSLGTITEDMDTATLQEKAREFIKDRSYWAVMDNPSNGGITPEVKQSRKELLEQIRNQ